MSDKNLKTHTEDPEQAIEAAIENTESYLQQNIKKLLIGLGVVVVLVALFFGYKYLVSAPREYKASADMYVAEQLFAADSFAVALNGSSAGMGFIEIADQYGSTKVGNTANHYAGICYAKLGEWENAIAYLKKYKPTDGIAAEVVNAQNSGLQGDVYVQLGSNAEALKMFEAAIKASSNDFTTPLYLKKAGLTAEKLGDNKKALDFYSTIKNQYPRSFEGRDIEKYIGKVSL